jgi:hypothetical protein
MLPGEETPGSSIVVSGVYEPYIARARASRPYQGIAPADMAQGCAGRPYPRKAPKSIIDSHSAGIIISRYWFALKDEFFVVNKDIQLQKSN